MITWFLKISMSHFINMWISRRLFLLNWNSNSYCSYNKSIISDKLIEFIYIYFINNKNSSENEKDSGKNKIVTWFLKYQFIYWNIEWAILLICEFQEDYSNKIEIVIVIVVLINQSFHINK